MSTRDHTLKPYAIHWRPDLVTGWLYLGDYTDTEEADDAGQRALDKWGGQVRKVVQHVTMVLPAQHQAARRARNYRALIDEDNRKVMNSGH